MRNRTPKTLGTRHEPSYVNRPTRFGRWRFWLALGVLLTAAVFLLGVFPFKSSGIMYSKVYSKGSLSSAHAFVAEKCEVCHVPGGNHQQPAGFLQNLMHGVSDNACLRCHEAPAHHSQGKQPAAPSCASCHVEHQGRQGLVRLSHVQDRACVNCHRNLDDQIASAVVQPKEARYIHKFNDDHPEFPAARERLDLIDESIDKKKKKLPGIIFHHSQHIGTTLTVNKGTNLEYVTLQCSDCHRPLIAENYAPWRYAQAGMALTAASPSAAQQPHPDAGREIMTMPTYEKNCARCHEIPFDGHFPDSSPHLKSNSEEELRRLHAFVTKKLQDYIQKYPDAIHIPDPPVSGVPEMKPLPPASSSKEWVDQRAARAEKFVLAGLKCKYCHQMDAPKPVPEELSRVPVVKPSGFKPRQMPFSIFSHDAHIALTCGSCHDDPAANKKKVIDPDIPDIKLPGIKTCEACHNGNPSRAGKAENSCFLCHQYHKWNERIEIPARYTFQQLGMPTSSDQR